MKKSALLGSESYGVGDILVMVLAGMLAAAAVAAVLGLLMAKYRDIFFAMLSLAFAMILFGLTLIGIIWLIYRYNLIMTTFREGVTVKGKVLDLETISSSNSKGGGRRYSYYGKFAYTVQNQPYETRMRIADNPHLMGLTEGGDIDLVLREEKPKTIFIKMLYLS